MDRLTEYEIISGLLSELKEEYSEKLSPKNNKNNNYDKNDMLRFSVILQAQGALNRIKDSAQSVENFVESLQRNFKEDKNG